MTITVIGHLCLDEIRHPDGRATASYGGIYFTVAALSKLLPAGDTVRPVFGVGKDDHQQFLEALASMPNMDASGIYRMQTPTNRVSLTYDSGPERVEVSRDISEPVPWKKIQPALDADLVLVNMISGFDVTLETLDEIRMRTRDRNIPVYFDVHSLTLGVREDFTRVRRSVDTWRRWLFMLHTVQMNEAEAAALTPEGYDEQNLVKQGLALNTRTLIVTRGGAGCTLFTNEKKHIVRQDFPGTPAKGSVDPTGCGDVFGAAYCAHLLHSGNAPAAAAFANSVAAAKAGLTGSSSLDELSRFRLDTAELKETPRMNIAIIGDGRMGMEVERLARQDGINVRKVFTAANNRGGRGLTAKSLRGIDVCVEFTLPGSAVKNIEAAANAGKPIVVGTTGWYDDLDEVRAIVEDRKTGLVYAPNFSVGVNILGSILRDAARLIDRQAMYDVAIRETHHRGKADSPSGTALQLGRIVLENVRRKKALLAGNAKGAIKPGQLHISSQRVGQAVGEHSVLFDSEADSLELVHRAKNRSGYAHGALIAAAWIRNRKGVYTMEDVLRTPRL